MNAKDWLSAKAGRSLGESLALAREVAPENRLTSR